MKNFIDYLLVVIIVLLGSTHAFMGDQTLIYVLFPLSLFCFVKRGGRFTHKGILFAVFIFSFLYVRGLNIGQNINGIALNYASLLSYFFMAFSIRDSFSERYVKVVVWLSIVSVIIWVGITISDDIYNTLRAFASNLPQFSNNDIVWETDTNPVYSMYVFEIVREKNGLIRNTGAFYEPGRQAVVILIALSIELFKNNSKLFTKNTIVLILALITTFSTMGYTGLLVIILGYSMLSDIKKSRKVLYLILFIPLVIYVYNLDFMADKISGEIANEESYSRFSAMAYHWIYIMKSPIWGNTFMELGSPNGITHIIAIYGIPFAIIYYYYLYQGGSCLVGNNHNHTMANICMFLVLLVNAFGQTITESPLYYTISCIGIISYFSNKKYKE